MGARNRGREAPSMMDSVLGAVFSRRAGLEHVFLFSSMCSINLPKLEENITCENVKGFGHGQLQQQQQQQQSYVSRSRVSGEL